MNTITLDELPRLPSQPDEIWQGGLVRLPSWIQNDEGLPVRARIAMWVETESGYVHVGSPGAKTDQPGEQLLQPLLELAARSGHRPGRVQVSDEAVALSLRNLLSEAEIAVEAVRQLEHLREPAEGIVQHMLQGEENLPGYLTGKGVKLAQVRRFAEAAADFYRAAPWQYLADSDLIEIESPTAPKGLQCLSVLGAGGETFGLGFFKSLAHFAQLVKDSMQGRENPASQKSLWQLVFDDEGGVPLADADLWEDEQLPMAGPFAVPLAWRIDHGQAPHRPDSQELDFLEALVRALASTTEEEIDSGRWSKQVESFLGTGTVTLSLPELLNPPSREELVGRGQLPDRRALESIPAQIERYFREHPAASLEEANDILNSKFVGKPAGMLAPPTTPLEQAQELCYQAFETPGRRAVQLARQAIDICPDCADAYGILAERTNPQAALRLFEQAVAAGERALGAEAFKEYQGHFWGATATRPYMRARFGLAGALLKAGDSDAAIDHYQALLQLNPNDNQGVRDVLLPLLLKHGRDLDAARLLKQFDDSGAIWAYSRALLAFRLSGRSVAAAAELRTAFRANPYAAKMIDSAVPLPPMQSYELGSPEEAIVCATELRGAFASTQGAIPWLKNEVAQREREAEKRHKERKRKERGQKRKRKK